VSLSLAPATAASAVEHVDPQQTLDQFAHRAAVDPEVAYEDATRQLASLRVARARARTDGDDSLVESLDVLISEAQERVFEARSNVLTYQQLQHEARTQTHVASATKTVEARPITVKADTHQRGGSYALVAILAVVLVAIILLPMPMIVRRRGLRA
jgi:hypothetical protein